MTVRLRRGDDLSDDSLVLIHMGAGAPLSVARAALRNFSDYVGVRSEGSGLFTISVFAVTAGVSEAEITGAFDHNQFGRSTYGTLRKAGLDLIATTIVDEDCRQASGRFNGCTTTSFSTCRSRPSRSRLSTQRSPG
jgi:hypothetical protein